MKVLNNFSKKRVFFLNRFPYKFLSDPNFFLDGVEDLCVLQTSDVRFDIPADKFNSAFICNFNNKDLMNDIVKSMYKNHQFNVVVNLTERYMEIAAHIRERFSIPGMDVITAKRFRNKNEMKKVVEEAGLMVPKYRKFTNKDDITIFFNEFGKCIIKPIDGMGAYKTFVINNLEDLNTISEEIDDFNNYLIEQFITGDMYHCDSVIVDGEIKLCSVSKYLNSALDYSDKGYLASVMIDDGPIKERIIEFNRKVIQSFGHKNGITHHEVFLSDKNELVFCEIAARAGGSGTIPSIIYAYGINLFKADVTLQLQGKITFPPTEKKSAGWLVIHRKEGIVADISSPEDFNFDWIYFKSIQAKRGDVLNKAENSAASIADFTITGNSEADVVRKIEMIRNEFKLETV